MYLLTHYVLPVCICWFLLAYPIWFDRIRRFRLKSIRALSCRCSSLSSSNDKNSSEMCKSISDKESEETLVLVAILKLMLLMRHSDQDDVFFFMRRRHIHHASISRVRIWVEFIHRVIEWWKGNGNPKPLLKWVIESTKHAWDDWDWGAEVLTEEDDFTGEIVS